MSELFPLEEEKEAFHGDGSVFNITFSGTSENSSKNEHGNAPLKSSMEQNMLYRVQS